MLEPTKNKLRHQILMEGESALDDIGRNLTGKLLTLVDASFGDPEQRKAFKDIVHSIMWDNYKTPTNQLISSIATEVEDICAPSQTAEMSYPKPIGAITLNPEKLDYKYTRTEK